MQGGKQREVRAFFSLTPFALGRVSGSGYVFSRFQLPTVSTSNHDLSSCQAVSPVTPGHRNSHLPKSQLLWDPASEL